MTQENKKKCAEMVGMANVYKSSSEVMNIGNILLKLLGKKQNIIVNDHPLNFDSVILPRIVLLAIDIEILLKAICLADNDNKPMGHNWVDLYNSLPESRKQEIIDSMPSEFQNDFMQYLDNNKDSFIKWRYAYENNGLTCDWSFIHELANVLGSIALKIVK